MKEKREKVLDKRQKAIEELQKQIREQRKKIDPKLLEMAEKAVNAAESGENGKIPYDRASATAAVEMFLKDHKDAGGFKKRLLDFLSKQSH